MVAVYHGDLYEILCVTKAATAAEIKSSYRKLAIKFHPDKNKDDGEKFKDISHAYGVLSDPEQRARYDLTYMPRSYRTNTNTSTNNTGASGSRPNPFNNYSNFTQGGAQPNPFTQRNFNQNTNTNANTNTYSKPTTASRKSRKKAEPKKPAPKMPEPKMPEPKKPFVGYTRPCPPTERTTYNFKERETYRIHAESTATLREVFNGSTINVTYKETLNCPKCLNGVKRVIQIRNCGTCNGHGALDKPNGAFPITTCPKCNGSGREEVNIVCKRCNDTPAIVERTIVLTLKKGLLPTQVHEVHNKGNLMHDGLRGDITFTINVDLHDDVFTLVEEGKLDLRCVCTITLEEALLGFENRKLCTHMDGKTLVSSQAPGRVIKPDTVRHIIGEGMPDPNDPNKRGNLELLFKVEFPEEIYPSERSVKAARRLFTDREPTPSPPPPFHNQIPEKQPIHSYKPTNNHQPTYNNQPNFSEQPISTSTNSYNPSPSERLYKPTKFTREESNLSDIPHEQASYPVSPDETSPRNSFGNFHDEFSSTNDNNSSRKRGYNVDSFDEQFFIPRRKHRYDRNSPETSYSKPSQKEPDVIVIDDDEDVIDMTNKLRSTGFINKKSRS